MKDIEPTTQETLSQILGQKVDFSVDYVISDTPLKDPTRENILNALLIRLKQLQLAEIASGVSLVGPHKHDIVFNFNGSNSRFYCSQGQQRAIILALKLGQISYFQLKNGWSPALLLDDVLSELDKTKQRFLVEFLEETDAQIFVTTTDGLFPHMLKNLNLKVFEIRNGVVFDDSYRAGSREVFEAR